MCKKLKDVITVILIILKKSFGTPYVGQNIGPNLGPLVVASMYILVVLLTGRPMHFISWCLMAIYSPIGSPPSQVIKEIEWARSA